MAYFLCKTLGGVEADAIRACSQWVSADSYVVANVYPSASDGAALVAWGFAVVVGPALIMWLGAVIVRGIRKVFGG